MKGKTIRSCCFPLRSHVFFFKKKQAIKWFSSRKNKRLYFIIQNINVQDTQLWVKRYNLTIIALDSTVVQKHIIFHISCIIVPLCPPPPPLLKRVDFYKVHRSEKCGVCWLGMGIVYILLILLINNFINIIWCKKKDFKLFYYCRNLATVLKFFSQ